MIFNIAKRNQEAHEMIAEAQAKASQAEEAAVAAVEAFNSVLQRTRTLQSRGRETALREFENIFRAIEDFEDSESKEPTDTGIREPGDDIPEAIVQEREDPASTAETVEIPTEAPEASPLQPLDNPEPLEAPKPFTGEVSAWIKAFGATVATALIFVVILAWLAKIPIDANLFSDLSAWMPAFDRLGMLFAPTPKLQSAVGIIVVIVTALGAGLALRWRIAAKNSATVLAAALDYSEQAEHYYTEQMAHKEYVQRKTRFLHGYAHALEGLEIFLGECVAVLRRILFVEGNQYPGWIPVSQAEIRKAMALKEVLGAMAADIPAQIEGEIVPACEQTLRQAESTLEVHRRKLYPEASRQPETV